MVLKNIDIVILVKEFFLTFHVAFHCGNSFLGKFSRKKLEFSTLSHHEIKSLKTGKRVYFLPLVDDYIKLDVFVPKYVYAIVIVCSLQSKSDRSFVYRQEKIYRPTFLNCLEFYA